MLDVVIISPQRLLFNGRAQRVVLPGEQGVFEVWPFHKPLLSRLLPGRIIVDEQLISIARGVVRVDEHKVIAVVEDADQ